MTADEVVARVRREMDGRLPHDDVGHLFTLKERMGARCRTYVEIGTYHGGSLSVVLQSATPTHFWSIDLFRPTSTRLGDYTKSNAPDAEIARRNIDRFNVHGHAVELVTGNSRGLRVRAQLAHLDIDLLFIDGDHSTRGVVLDFASYQRQVTIGGLVVFDDYDYPDVELAVRRVLLRYPGFEFVEVVGRECVLQKVRNAVPVSLWRRLRQP